MLDIEKETNLGQNITEVANLLASLTRSINWKTSSSGAGNNGNFLPEKFNKW